ncbi:MAG: heavy metal translocating P-type ATPase [Eubacteriales bacterium]|nr:heavy metal translocating P-type ATPase [Eubacteriales bacterium]
MRKRFKISEMHCAACQASIEKLLKELKGVKQYKVNLLKAYADIEFKQSQITDTEISETLSKAGFPTEVDNDYSGKISFKGNVEAEVVEEKSIQDILDSSPKEPAELAAETPEELPAKTAEIVDSEPAEVAETAEAELAPDTSLLEELPNPEFSSELTEEEPAQTEAEISAIDQEAKAERERRRKLHDPLRQEEERLKRRLIYSFILMLPLIYFMLEMIPGINLPLPGFMQGNAGAANRAFAQLLFTMPILFINEGFFKSGFNALLKRHPNMDSLVAIGAGSAFFYGVFVIFKLITALMTGDHAVIEVYAHQLYLDSAAMIVTLISLGKYFELRAKQKTSSAVEDLLELAPAACTVIRDGREERMLASNVEPGSHILLKPGERVALDGVIVEGRSSFDEQAITGESMGVDKEEGDEIFAGSLNQNGVIIYKSTKRADDTLLAEIVELVENAAASKAKISRLADRVAAIFVPTVIAIAVITFIVWQIVRGDFEWSMKLAISVLLISCPCALGLATPVAIMVAAGRAAKDGILIKDAQSLEAISQISDLLLDKTGTITHGRPEIVAIEPDPAGELSERDLLELAASIEAGSSHPLAKAVLNKAAEVGIEPYPQEAGEALPGRGVYARIYGQNYFAGNLALLREAGLSSAEVEQLSQRVAEQGYSTLLIFSEDRYLGLLAASDQLKAEAPWILRTLQKSGLETLLLTGDQLAAAKSIARRLDLAPERVMAELLPQDKARVIKERQADGKLVAMLGDGINDAPALTVADLGIAVGAGTDIAIDSADVVLMRSDLGDLLTFFQLGKETVKIIKQNLFWAFFYNVLGIPLAAGVFYPYFGWTLNPIFAAAAMSISSIFVVSNALRLRSFVPSWQKQTKAITEQTEANGKLGRFNLGRKPNTGKFLEAKKGENVNTEYHALPEDELAPVFVTESEAEAKRLVEESSLPEIETEAATADLADVTNPRAVEAAGENRETLEVEEAEPNLEVESIAAEPVAVEAIEAEPEKLEPREIESDEAQEEPVKELHEEEADEVNESERKRELESAFAAKLEAQKEGVDSPAKSENNIWQDLYKEQAEPKLGVHKLKIEGMKCQNCVKKLTTAFMGIPGIEDLEVDLEQKEARFKSASKPDIELIKKTITACGYKLKYMVSPKE